MLACSLFSLETYRVIYLQSDCPGRVAGGFSRGPSPGDLASQGTSARGLTWPLSRAPGAGREDAEHKSSLKWHLLALRREVAAAGPSRGPTGSPGRGCRGSWRPALVSLLSGRHLNTEAARPPPGGRGSAVTFFCPCFMYENNAAVQAIFSLSFFAQEAQVLQQVQFCWSICFRQGSMVTATPTPLRPDVMWVTSLQVSVSGS